MQAHQFVAIGDIHLRSSSSRNEVRLKAFDQIIGEGLALPQLAAWLLLGDVFDGRSGVDDRNQLAERLLRMAERAPVLGVYGNHCAPFDLEVFSKLGGRWPIVFASTPRMWIGNTPTKAIVAVAMLPYPHKAGLVAGGVTADSTLQTGAEHLEAIIRGFAGDLAGARERGHLPLFIGHVNVEGAETSNGQPSIGRELSMTTGVLSLLDASGPVPKILGHIHKAQEIGGAFYAGSIAPCTWGEVEEKRYLVVEYEEAA